MIEQNQFYYFTLFHCIWGDEGVLVNLYMKKEVAEGNNKSKSKRKMVEGVRPRGRIRNMGSRGFGGRI